MKQINMKLKIDYKLIKIYFISLLIIMIKFSINVEKLIINHSFKK